MAELPAPQKVATLMAEFRAQQKTLADVETQLLEAADEAAHDILMAARTEIRAALVKARRELLDLTTDVASVTNTAFDPARETLLATRQYMHTVLAETRTDLHSVDTEATSRGFQLELDPATLHIQLPARRPKARARKTAARRLIGSGLLIAAGVAAGALGVVIVGQMPTERVPQLPSIAAATEPVQAVAPTPERAVPSVETVPPVQTVPPVIASVIPPVVAAAAPAPAPPPAPVTAPPAKPLPLREELLNASQRWLDAYYRQDKATMAKITIAEAAIEDERTDAERLPPGLSNVQRRLTGVNFHQTDTVAMITANMVERSGDARGAESYISHLWVRQNGRWQLQTVRLTAAPALAPSVQ